MAVTTSPTEGMSTRDPGSPPPEGRSSSPPPPALHTYPPSLSSSYKMADIVPPSSNNSGSWNVGVPSWLRMPSIPSMPSRRTLTNVLGGIRTSEPQSITEGGSVSEVLSSNAGSGSHMSGGNGTNDFGYFSILETPATTLDDESIEKFRSSFAFDEKETLLGGESLFSVAAHISSDQSQSSLGISIAFSLSMGVCMCRQTLSASRAAGHWLRALGFASSNAYTIPY